MTGGEDEEAFYVIGVCVLLCEARRLDERGNAVLKNERAFRASRKEWWI